MLAAVLLVLNHVSVVDVALGSIEADRAVEIAGSELLPTRTTPVRDGKRTIGPHDVAQLLQFPSVHGLTLI